jgi:hypothetical protein
MGTLGATFYPWLFGDGTITPPLQPQTRPPHAKSSTALDPVPMTTKDDDDNLLN